MDNGEMLTHRQFMVTILPNRDNGYVCPMFMQEFGERISHTLVWNYGDFVRFTTGITDLRHFYQLSSGGFLNLFYMDRSDFYMRVYNPGFYEVLYPTPPVTRRIGWRASDYEFGDYESDPDEDNVQFFTKFYFSIKHRHLINRKHLAPTMVSTAMLPFRPFDCVLRDSLGRRYYCDLHWHPSMEDRCYITGGWSKFVERNEVQIGFRMWMEVDWRDPCVIHIGKAEQ